MTHQTDIEQHLASAQFCHHANETATVSLIHHKCATYLQSDNKSKSSCTIKLQNLELLFTVNRLTSQICFGPLPKYNHLVSGT